MAEIREDETIDILQMFNIQLLQKKNGFRFGMDAVLLSDFARITPNAHVGDFGTGTGILPLLLQARGKGNLFEAFEIQPEMADMAKRTMQMNELHERIRVHYASVQEAPQLLGPNALDAIICNPPYGSPGSTTANPLQSRAIARHQLDEGLISWYRAAHFVLGGKGRFFMIYPAPQLTEALDALRQAHLEPKRLRFIHPMPERPANLVMIEAMKDGKPMLQCDPPLIVHQADGAETEEIRRIYTC